MTAENDPDAGTTLDQAGAWRLLLALSPGAARVRDPVSGAELRLSGPHGWDVSPAPGPGATLLLDLLLPLRRRPTFVVGQLGQSVDGRIATVTGHSHYINGPEDIRRLHRLRALSDAVVVGAGTVASDDPRLTVREVEGRDPVRVVLDPSGRLDPDRRVFRDGAVTTLWLQGEEGAPRGGGATDADAAPGPRPGGTGGEGLRKTVEVIRLPTAAGQGFDPAAVVSLLAARGHRRVLVEGGGITVSRFLAAGVLDRLHLSVAPLILGSGRPGIQLPPIRTLDEALRPPTRHFVLGTDLLFDLDLSPGAR